MNITQKVNLVMLIVFMIAGMVAFRETALYFLIGCGLGAYFVLRK